MRSHVTTFREGANVRIVENDRLMRVPTAREKLTHLFSGLNFRRSGAKLAMTLLPSLLPNMAREV